MKGAKYILTAAVIAMSSVMMTGCFKPSKDAVVESKYYQSLKDERDKLSVQLKEEKKKTKTSFARICYFVFICAIVSKIFHCFW